jgi:hypothetical protein
MQDEITEQVLAALGGFHGQLYASMAGSAQRKDTDSLEAYVACTISQRLLGRPLELQPTVQLAFGGGRADRPNPEPAPLAAGVGLRCREQERRVAIPALDRHRRARLPRRGPGRSPARHVSGEAGLSVTVTNTGDRRGTEVVQLHAADTATGVTLPAQQLIGFARLDLEPGTSKTVAFAVPMSLLAYTGLTGEFVMELVRWR